MKIFDDKKLGYVIILNVIRLCLELLKLNNELKGVAGVYFK